ncbi:MAG: MBL fold metallo-hydrolase [Gammaproteobacteria bacterium]
MKLIFIGAGSAFTSHCGNYNSNMLLIDEENNEKLLIDCGSDARHALTDLGYCYKDISSVYISHLHADHAGGLEWLALTTKFDPSADRPSLYANRSIIKNLWDNTLSGGLSTIQGIKATLDSFFKVHEVENDGSFIWNDVQFQTVQTVHIVANFVFMPSYGLIFTINGTKIFITTDTQFAPSQLRDIYRDVDVIFHDCETTAVASGVHAHFKDLVTLDESIKSKMWLYHYNPGELPDAKAYGFLGFVKRGQIFEF